MDEALGENGTTETVSRNLIAGCFDILRFTDYTNGKALTGNIDNRRFF